MDVKINQVILHILDAGASEPVLSDRPMELNADLYEYFSVCIEKAFASDDSKNCRFLPDSPFLQEMQHNDDFIDLSRRIAGVIFEQLLQYQGIPSGDLAVVDCAADGVPFYAVLKLNYRPGFTHVTNVMGNGQCSTIAPQRTLLPGNSKADEAALIDRANLTIRLIEKKVALDDKKDFYLSTKVFACTQAMPEKAKLKAVCETAVAAVQQAYPEPEQLDDVPPFDGGTETAVELLVRNQAVDNTISVEDVRNLIVNPESDKPVTLAAVADIVATEGPGEIRRSDQERVAIVSANLRYGDLGTAASAATALSRSCEVSR